MSESRHEQSLVGSQPEGDAQTACCILVGYDPASGTYSGLVPTAALTRLIDQRIAEALATVARDATRLIDERPRQTVSYADEAAS